jgi:hypothetical protein
MLVGLPNGPEEGFMLARSTRRATTAGGFLRFLTGSSILFAACRDPGAPVNPSAGAPSAEEPASTEAGAVIPGSFIVVFKPDAADPPGLADRLVREHGGTVQFAYCRRRRSRRSSTTPTSPMLSPT